MDLLSAMSELASRPPTTGLPCSVSVFLTKINDKEKEAFEVILADSKIGVLPIQEMLAKNGYQVAKTSLYKHRRKMCRCFL